MPVIDGEKFACASCIKGHRVSGCNHSDRELHHINPKGRPVKQCEHCRGARKSKSHHAKCDCGDKKDKEKNKDKGDANVTEHHCGCHSGTKCMCGVKDDTLDLKLDTGKQSLHSARGVKPKLTTTHSESTLTVFANGHHKPCHRNNNTAHVSGTPYKIPRPHTLHGQSAFAQCFQSNGYGRPEATTQRSADTLSLSNTDFHAMFGTQSSGECLALTNEIGSAEGNRSQDSFFTGYNSTLRQDGDSPSDSHLSDTITGQQWPWTSTITPVNPNFGYGSLSTSPSQDCLPNLGDWAIPSAGLDNPLWSAGDLPLDPSKLNDSLTQPISHSGESHQQSNPGLTTASSSHSEIGESILFPDLDLQNPQSTVSESLFWEDNPVFRLPNSIPPPTSIPAGTIADSQAFDLGFAKNMSASSSATAGSSPLDEQTLYSPADYNEPAISIPNNVDDTASSDPWSISQNNVFGGLGAFDMYSNQNFS